MGDYSPSSSSLKHRLKNSIYGCFKHNNPHQHHQLHSDPDNNDWSPQSHHHHHRTLVRSFSGGAAGMMRHLIHRIGTPRNGHHHHHRKSKSTDFRYDPQSYNLNFDDDDNAAAFDEFPFRDFTSRLPPSPSTPNPTRLKAVEVAVARPSPLQPPPSSSSSPREITACS